MPPSTRNSTDGGFRRNYHVPYRSGDHIMLEHVEPRSDGSEDVFRRTDKRTPPPVMIQAAGAEEVRQMSEEITPLQFMLNKLRKEGRLNSGGQLQPPVAPPSHLDADTAPSPRGFTSVHVDLDEEMTPLQRVLNLQKQNEASLSNPRPGGPSMKTFTSPRPLLPGRKLVRTPAMDSPGSDNSKPGVTNGSPDDQRRTSLLEPSPHKASSIDQTDADIDDRAKEVPLEFVAETISDNVAKGPRNGKKSADSLAEPETQSLRTPNQNRRKRNKGNRYVPKDIRRSPRRPYKPLEWWRGEKVVYGKGSSSGPILVPHIKEIKRIPKEPPSPLRKRKRSATRKPDSISVLNPEDELAANDNWLSQNVFGDEDFIVAGQLIIPPRCRKPSKETKDNTYVDHPFSCSKLTFTHSQIFYVIEGAVNLKIHETSLVVATGGMFMVPRGNTYFIENIAERDAKLFFTQARKAAVADGSTSHAGGSLSHSVSPHTEEQAQTTERSLRVAQLSPP